MKLSSVITQSEIFYSLATKEKLPENSDDLKIILSNIDKLDTYSARKKYAENNLEHLSSGSSRIVYQSPKHTIIKLAKNDKGIAQNKVEAHPKIKSEYLNQILSFSKKYSWIETYYLEKITEKEFEEMTGVNFSDFGEAIKYGLKDISGSSKSKPSNFDKIQKSKIFKEIKKIAEACNLMPGDLSRISSWGTKDDKPVLIDAGLTKEVFEKFYEKDSS